MERIRSSSSSSPKGLNNSCSPFNHRDKKIDHKNYEENKNNLERHAPISFMKNKQSEKEVLSIHIPFNANNNENKLEVQGDVRPTCDLITKKNDPDFLESKIESTKNINSSYSNINQYFKFNSKTVEKNYHPQVNKEGNPKKNINESQNDIKINNSKPPEKGLKIYEIQEEAHPNIPKDALNLQFKEEVKHPLIQTPKNPSKFEEEKSHNFNPKASKIPSKKIPDFSKKKILQAPKEVSNSLKPNKILNSRVKSSTPMKNINTPTSFVRNPRINPISSRPLLPSSRPGPNPSQIRENSTYEQLGQLDEHNFDKGNGFTVEEISQLISFKSGCTLPEVCSVCNDPIEKNQFCIALTCLDKYHEDCIIEWLQRKKTCPVCRCEVPISLKKH